MTVKDHPEDKFTFELIDKVGGQVLVLKLHREVKEFWLKEIREFAKNHGKKAMGKFLGRCFKFILINSLFMNEH